MAPQKIYGGFVPMVVVISAPILLLLAVFAYQHLIKTISTNTQRLELIATNISGDITERMEMIGLELQAINSTNLKTDPTLNKLFSSIKLLDLPAAIAIPKIQVKQQKLYAISPISSTQAIIGSINQQFLFNQQGLADFGNIEICIWHGDIALKCYNKLGSTSSIQASTSIKQANTILTPKLMVTTKLETAPIIKKWLQDLWSIFASGILVIFGLYWLVCKIEQRFKLPLQRILKQVQGELADTDDENSIDSVISSINNMRLDLDYQQATSSTLARVDNIILHNMSINKAMQAIKQRIETLLNPQIIDIYMTVDPLANNKPISYKNVANNMHVKLSRQEQKLLTGEFVLISKHNTECYQWYDKQKALSFLLILPLQINNHVVGFIILGFKKKPRYRKIHMHTTQEIVNRLAVAMSNYLKENKLYHQANYDLLTDLPNRLLLQKRLDDAILQAQAKDNHVVLMFVDLDDFKSHNDSFGHNIGDKFLQATAKRIKDCVGPWDTVARYGGDEFIVILPSNDNIQKLHHRANTIASNIQLAIAKPCEILGNILISNCSIGVAIYKQDADNADDLLKAADAALYYAKSHKDHKCQFFSTDLSKEAKESFVLEHSLNNALVNNEFELYLQPRIDLKSNQIVSAEALLRWSSKGTYISPEEFIPIAESNGLIQTVGEWILTKACTMISELAKAGIPISISVNISAKQLQNIALVSRITHIINKTGIQPHKLELELTESILMRNSTYVLDLLSKLRNMGIKVAIDDFGTGFSSFGYLKNFAVDILKIDKSFIHGISHNHTNRAIVSAILTLAQQLDIATVAEGVEHSQDLAWLTAHSCNEVQGFIYSPPLPFSKFVEFSKQYPRQKLINTQE